MEKKSYEILTSELKQNGRKIAFTEQSYLWCLTINAGISIVNLVLNLAINMANYMLNYGKNLIIGYLITGRVRFGVLFENYGLDDVNQYAVYIFFKLVSNLSIIYFSII